MNHLISLETNTWVQEKTDPYLEKIFKKKQEPFNESRQTVLLQNYYLLFFFSFLLLTFLVTQVRTVRTGSYALLFCNRCQRCCQLVMIIITITGTMLRRLSLSFTIITKRS